MYTDAVLPISDGRIYHLDLAPEELADTVITVGDRARVSSVSKYFDQIDVVREHREFVTHTGTLGGKRLTVLSTGIGTPNIDIVLNELDALRHIDFTTRERLPAKQPLQIVRFGTTGGLSPTVSLGDVVVSQSAIGLDGLLHYYQHDESETEHAFLESVIAESPIWPIPPYIAFADAKLVNRLNGIGRQGITVTAPGFYGPQGRVLLGALSTPNLLEKLANFSYAGMHVLNLEMETSAILGMARNLGHQATSIAVILADRLTGEFANDPDVLVDKMIKIGLEKLVSI